MQICSRCGALRPWAVERCPQCEQVASPDLQLFAQIFQEAPPHALKGRYTIVETLAHGRVSATYRVRDSQGDGAYYALKEISEIALLIGDEKRHARQAFQEHMARWSRLRHPNLPQIIDVFSSGDKHYVLTSLVSGWNLTQLIQHPSLPLSEETARNWGAQLCDLLSYLHQQSPPIILGELRPEHVMVTRDGLVQLVSLNLTRIFLPEQETDPRSAGASPYTAPEFHSKAYTPATDIYALGMLLYTIIARRLLSDGESARALLRRSISPRAGASRSTMIPGVSQQFEAIILRATRRDPEARFPSVGEFRLALWGKEPITRESLIHLQTQPPAEQRLEREPAVQPALRQGIPRQAISAAQPAPAKVATTQAAVQPAQEARARLLVRPRHLALEPLAVTEKRAVSFTVYNAGEADLEGRFTSQVAWLTLGRSAFQCAPHRSCDIPATIWGARLPAGDTGEPQAILVESNAGRQWISVQATVAVNPALALESDILDFGEVQGTKEVARQVTVTNSGGGVLEGTVRSRVAWLHIPSPRFHCPPQRSAQVQVKLRPELLAIGRHEVKDALAVDSDAGQASIPVRVARVQPTLMMTPTYLDFGPVSSGGQAERALVIANEGSGVLEYSLLSREPWLHVSPEPGRCAAGEKRETLIIVDASHLEEGDRESSEAITVRSNAGTLRIPAKVTVLAPRLALAEERLDFGQVPLGQAVERYLVIENAGSAPLHCRLDSRLAWLIVTPSETTIAPKESAQVTVIADTSSFSRGQAVDVAEALHISSNAGDRDIPLRMLVLLPALDVEPEKLDFGLVDRVTPASLRLIVRNRDTGLLEWKVKTDALWVEIAPRQGICRAGSEREIMVTAYGLALSEDVENATATLSISSNGGDREIPMSIAIASPQLDVDIVRIDLGTSINHAPVESSFLVFNHGLGTLRGDIQVRSDRLSVEPVSFECPTGASQVIYVRTNGEGLPSGFVEEKGGIVVESNGGKAEIDVLYEVLLKPELKVSLAPLVLADDGGSMQGKLILKNAGFEVAQADIRPSSSQLDIARRSCTIKPGKTLSLPVSLSLPVQTEPEGLYIDITSKEKVMRVPVEVESAR